MKRLHRISFCLTIVFLAATLSGCVGLAHRSQQVSVQEDAYPSVHKLDDAEITSEESAADVGGTDGPSVDGGELSEETDEQARHMLAEAEALLATGVAANRDGRWYDAQVSFEQATSLLADLDVQGDLTLEDVDGTPLGEDPDPETEDVAEQSARLLREIANEYRQTLLAIGELGSDASLLAFLLRFESLESLRQEQLDSTTLVIANERERSGQVEFDFPIELNDQVTNCVVYFQTVAHDAFETYLRRSGRYLPMMKEIVASYGLPTDIAYLPLIESGFNDRAYSYAHAAGPWQFISSTGHRYGLTRNVWFDERRDFEKSTHGACRYLGDLYEMFGSWPLALASYNGGEGRVGRQIKRQNTRDFWKLKLHKQTRNYVPLFMAALMIAKDPKAFGFDVEPDAPLEYDWVATNKALELTDIARSLGCTKETIANLNPELRRDVTPPDVKPYRLRVPKGKGEVFAHVYHNLPESERTQWVQHTISRGETLSGISRRYGVRASEIASHNKLRSTNFLRVGQQLEIPVPVAELSRYAEKRTTSSSSSKTASADATDYKVKQGDTLWDLAKKFGTTTSGIRRANKMSAHEKLIAGARIKIPGKSSPSQDNFWHKVRRGDTMSRIAAKYGVALKKLIASNKSVNPDQIRVGQRILIPAG